MIVVFCCFILGVPFSLYYYVNHLICLFLILLHKDKIMSFNAIVMIVMRDSDFLNCWWLIIDNFFIDNLFLIVFSIPAFHFCEDVTSHPGMYCTKEKTVFSVLSVLLVSIVFVFNFLQYFLPWFGDCCNLRPS